LSHSHEVGFAIGFLVGVLSVGDDVIFGSSGIAVRKRFSKSLEVRALGAAHTTAACIAVAAVSVLEKPQQIQHDAAVVEALHVQKLAAAAPRSGAVAAAALPAPAAVATVLALCS
jgi:hypothetical protein